MKSPSYIIKLFFLTGEELFLQYWKTVPHFVSFRCTKPEIAYSFGKEEFAKQIGEACKVNDKEIKDFELIPIE
jgi:hypothetical protein